MLLLLLRENSLKSFYRSLNSSITLCGTGANYYGDLGLSKSATKSEIKSAFYSLSKLYHPDKISKERDKEKAADEFRKISEAYRVLGNDERKRHYDRVIGNFNYGDSGSGSQPFYKQNSRNTMNKTYGNYNLHQSFSYEKRKSKFDFRTRSSVEEDLFRRWRQEQDLLRRVRANKDQRQTQGNFFNSKNTSPNNNTDLFSDNFQKMLFTSICLSLIIQILIRII